MTGNSTQYTKDYLMKIIQYYISKLDNKVILGSSI